MIGREAIFKLLPDRQGPCISLYVPTNEAVSGEQDAVRVQNLLRCVDNDLQLYGVDDVDTRTVLDTAGEQPIGSSFWREASQGVVAFLAPGFSLVEHVPYPIAMQYRLGDRFHILPLLPMVDPFRRFFVLSLNQEHIQFFEATPHSMNEITLIEAPEPARSTMRGLILTSRAPGFHFSDVVDKGDSFAMSIDQDRLISSMDKHHNDLLDSLRSIDRQLHQLLMDERAPLVLAGFGFIASLYEGVNSYRNLLPVRIPGSPFNWTTDELHAYAVDIVMPFLERDRQIAVSAFDPEGSQLQTTMTDLSEIVIAADRGQVKTLFLARHGECDGFYNEEQRSVTFDPAGENLLEFAATRTLLHGGQACVLDREEMPDRQVLAAILRTNTFNAP